jgi:hypothetical protein
VFLEIAGLILKALFSTFQSLNPKDTLNLWRAGSCSVQSRRAISMHWLFTTLGHRFGPNAIAGVVMAMLLVLLVLAVLDKIETVHSKKTSQFSNVVTI